MSDKASHVPNQQKRHGLFSKIIALILLIAVVLIIVAFAAFPDELNVDAMRRWFTYLNKRGSDTYGEYHYDAHNSNLFGAFGDGLAIASVAGLNGYDGSGTLMTTAQAQFSQPYLLTAGDYALAYDAAGHNLLEIHTQRGEVLRVEEPQFIYDADLSSDGAACYSSSTPGHKSVLTVYDTKQNLIYRWLSSSMYMPLCAVSEGGRYLAAVGLGQTDGVFESRLYLFKTDTESPLLDVSLGNDMPYDLYFCDSDTVCVIGESGVTYVDTAGTVTGSCSYSQPFIKEYDRGGNGFLTLLVNMYSAGNRNTLQCVDHNGGELGSLYLGEDVLDISAAGKYVAVLTNENLSIFNSALEVYAQTVETRSATSVVMRPDGSALLLGSSDGSLFIP